MRWCCLVFFALLLDVAALAATDLPATIATNTTLSAAGSPYSLKSDVMIPAGVIVTVSPPVQIVAEGDFRLFIHGTLQGVGTATQGIVFRAADGAAKGAWQGLYVASGGRCQLQRATVKNAVTNVLCFGGAVTLDRCTLSLASGDALYGWGTSTVQLANCTFRGNTGRGVCFEGYQASGSISGCQFRDGGTYPVRLKATLAEMLKGGNRYQGNAVQRIAVSCSLVSDITDDDLWSRQTIPFELGAEETDQVLDIAAGGRLLIPAGSGVIADGLQCHGRLDVAGTATAGCLLGPRSLGNWRGLTLYPGSTANLRFVTLSGAETGVTAEGATLRLTDSAVQGGKYDGLRLTGATALTLARTAVTGNGRDGLRLEGQALTGTVTACRLEGNGGHPVWALARNVGLLGLRNTYGGNGIERIGVSCGGDPDLASGTFTWTAQGPPLDLTVNPSGTVLNIAAPATLNLVGAQTLHLGGLLVSGTLNVSATARAPVRFRPPAPSETPGAWTGLQWDGGGGTLTGADIEFAENGVNLTNASPRLDACTVTHSKFDGLVCAGTSSPVITHSRFLANGRDGVRASGTANPNLGDLTTPSTLDDGLNTLKGNGGYDLYNDTANALRAQNNQWVSTNPTTIAARIFDQADSASRGQVIFTPVRQTAPAASVAAGGSGAVCAFIVTSAGGGSVCCAWTQTVAARVEVTVTNLAGRTVGQACRDRLFPAGRAEILWSRRGSQGTRIPAGAYLVVLQSGRLDGTSTRLVAPLTLR